MRSDKKRNPPVGGKNKKLLEARKIKKEMDLGKTFKEIAFLYRFSTSLVAITDYRKLLEFTINEAVRITNSEMGIIWLYDKIKKTLIAEKSVGLSAEDIPKLSIAFGKCPVWQTFESGELRNIFDEKRAIHREEPILKKYNIRSCLLLPLRIQKENIGVLELDRLRKQVFNRKEERLLNILVANFTIAFGNIKNYENLKRREEELRRNVRELKKSQLTMLNLVKSIRKSKEELQKSEQKFRDLTETLPDLVWEINENNAFIYVSPVVKNLLGYEVNEVLGKFLFDFIPAENVGKIKKVFEEKIFKKEPINRLEVPILRKDKHLVILEINAIPLFDKEKRHYGYRGIARDITHEKAKEFKAERFKGFRGIAHDITEHKKLEAALQEEKNKLEKYFDVAGVIVLVVSPEGKVLLINKKGCEILEREPQEIIGKDWFANFIPERNRIKTRSFFEKLINGKKSKVRYFKGLILAKGGNEKIIAWGNTLIEDEKGEIQAVLSTGGDITDLKRAETTISQLREVDQIKDEFLNIAAHELKTPLTSIIGLSDIIKKQKVLLSPKIAEYLDVIYNESIRLGHVVKNILTVTRFESGKATIQLAPINLFSHITSLLPALEIITKSKKMSIIANIKDKNLQIESDKEKLSEVITNLVDNAIKYGTENQTITISAYRINGDKVRIEVTDQGQGISSNSVDKLFNKFAQLEPSLSRTQEGTGLGLYICKLIVKKLGGEIGVKSKIGKGSAFFFTLPLSGKKNK